MTSTPAGDLDATPGPVVVMGVAGCGKTTIGQLPAARLGVPYAEADSFHPVGNVEKMRCGIPLTDQDRQPWLSAIADRMRHHELLASGVLLVAEVVSPSSRRSDRVAKARAYAQGGIPLYLISDNFANPPEVILLSQPGEHGYAAH